jgi:hypothetical protein
LSSCGDPLMDSVTIYNCVNRREAGFSHVLQDIHGRRPDRYTVKKEYCNMTMRYFELIHRVTGSGASFEKDHGYRNTIVPTLHTNFVDFQNTVKWFHHFGKVHPRPTIFTSIGNQIPAFPKPINGFTSGGWMYLAMYAPVLAKEYHEWLEERYFSDKKTSHRAAVDWILNWHVHYGLKKFHFVLTAWVMDTQEYVPDFVDPWSICNYGKNAYEAIDLMYVNDGKLKKSDFYDSAVIDVCSAFNAKPYDIEDILCDYIRYVENYVPKKDYEHIDLKELFNNSSITNHPKGRQAWKRGTDQWVW